MDAKPLKIFLLGHEDDTRLEQSYARAFRALGHEVRTFPIQDASYRHVKLGRLASKFHQFVPVEEWVRKGNRDLIFQAMSFCPDLVCCFIPYSLRAGALAQLLCAVPAKVAMVWPDPLLNLDSHVQSILPLIDVFGTYCRATVGVIQKLGAPNVQWLPLAADPALHPASIFSDAELAPYRADVSFIGNWRPEREEVIKRILVDAPELHVRVWGPSWERSQDSAVRKVHEGRSAVGVEFTKIARASLVNINIIDPGNHTGANMRFFELPCCGGMQVSMYCEELSEDFRDGHEIVYVHKESDWGPTLRRLVADPVTRAAVANQGHRMVLAKHTYGHRASTLLGMLGFI